MCRRVFLFEGLLMAQLTVKTRQVGDGFTSAAAAAATDYGQFIALLKSDIQSWRDLSS